MIPDGGGGGGEDLGSADDPLSAFTGKADDQILAHGGGLRGCSLPGSRGMPRTASPDDVRARAFACLKRRLTVAPIWAGMA